MKTILVLNHESDSSSDILAILKFSNRGRRPGQYQIKTLAQYFNWFLTFCKKKSKMGLTEEKDLCRVSSRTVFIIVDSPGVVAVAKTSAVQ